MAKELKKALLKDPDSTLDYNIDWEAWLDGDQIIDSTWDIPIGLSSTGNIYAATGLTTVWLSGGTVGEMYTVINRITTLYGRYDERSFNIVMVER